MGGQEPRKAKKHICAGLLAHVDAGKTTLAERMLYTAGKIRNPGRVDHRDTFLDTDAAERSRGGHGCDASGHTGTCGFFGGDGTDAAGSGLRGADCQRCGRRAEPYADTLAVAGTLSGAGFSFCQ